MPAASAPAPGEVRAIIVALSSRVSALIVGLGSSKRPVVGCRSTPRCNRLCRSLASRRRRRRRARRSTPPLRPASGAVVKFAVKFGCSHADGVEGWADEDSKKTTVAGARSPGCTP